MSVDQSKAKVGRGTLAVHSGIEKNREGIKSVVPPIQLSVSYMAEDPDDLRAVLSGEKEGYVYTRNGNPTVQTLQKCIAELEGADEAVVFGSGMAALHASLLAVVTSLGKKIVASNQLYGVTISLLNNVFTPLGVQVIYTDLLDIENAREVIEREKPACVLCETVSNPLLKVADIESLAEITRGSGVMLLVDNTFATPLVTRPLELGADLSITSTTKYLAGHGDVMGGAVAGAWDICGQVRGLGVYSGGIMGAFEAWLTLRGIRTLGVRVPRQSSNANTIARMLASHPKVSTVHYPGLENHPQHTVASKVLQNGYGGMVAFELTDNSVDAANKFMSSLGLCLPATSLGDVYTLVLHPVSSTHLTVSAEDRERMGITPGLMRLSAGIEEPEDILADLAQALERV